MGLAKRKVVAAPAGASVAGAPVARAAARRPQVGGLPADGDVMARIRLVRAGVPSRRVQEAADALGWSKEQLYSSLGIARATVDRKIREDRPLSADEGERVLGLLQLIQDVERMYEESGDPDVVDFVPARWLGEWLAGPNPALGGECPAALLDTADGRTLVGRLLGAMQAGTYW